MAKNGQLKLKESDKPSVQTELAFSFLVNEDNIERTMGMTGNYRKTDMMTWARAYCIDESPLTVTGAEAVDWGQVADGLFLSLIIMNDAQEQVDEQLD